MEEIKPGEYKIPEGYRALLKDHHRVVEIKELERSPIGYKCKDCVHFTEGHTKYSYSVTTICDLKPKQLSDSIRKSLIGMKFKGMQLYYHVYKYGDICDNFELKKQ